MQKTLLSRIKIDDHGFQGEFLEIINLLSKMRERKAFSKTDRKTISSIKSFIKNNYLRIQDVDKLILLMYELEIIKSFSSSAMVFHEYINSLLRLDTSDFNEYLTSKLKKKHSLDEINEINLMIYK